MPKRNAFLKPQTKLGNQLVQKKFSNFWGLDCEGCVLFWLGWLGNPKALQGPSGAYAALWRPKGGAVMIWVREVTGPS